MLDKNLVRKEYIQKRNLVLQDFEDFAYIEENFFLWLTRFSNISDIAAYHPTNKELDITSLLTNLFDKGYNILLPKIVSRETMEFVKWDGSLQKNDQFAFMEPGGGQVRTPEIAIIPLISCDIKGNRVGYGKGFYDRYLENNDIIKISLIPEALITPDIIKKEQHDIKLDYIITEKEIISTS